MRNPENIFAPLAFSFRLAISSHLSAEGAASRVEVARVQCGSHVDPNTGNRRNQFDRPARAGAGRVIDIPLKTFDADRSNDVNPLTLIHAMKFKIYVSLLLNL